MRNIDTIVIHCADTPASMDIGVREIRDWHVNGNKWKDVGYHYIIRRDGTLEKGRKIEIVGSHVYGFNNNSIGICLVGGKVSKGEKMGTHLFTKEQFDTLESLLLNLKGFLNTDKLRILGHYQLDKKKTCPNFNVSKWLKEKELI